MDEVGAKLRQVLEAQPSLREQALVLLSVVQPHSMAELAELLQCERRELMPALGPYVQEELVRFSRVDGGDAVHWYATAKGRQVGNELYQRAARHLPEVPALEPLADLPPAPPEPRQRPSLGKRRRVVIGAERQQPSERAFTFGE